MTQRRYETAASPASARPDCREDELEALRRRAEEAEDALHAIRTGAVDAFVVEKDGEERVYTLETADRPYRLLVESMQQGALVLAPDGTVLFANGGVAGLLELPPDGMPGTVFTSHVVPEDREAFQQLLRDGQSEHGVQGELSLEGARGRRWPAHVTVNPLPGQHGSPALCLVVTDLTQQKQYEEVRRAQEALQASEERFRAVFEQGAVPMAEIEIDRESYRFLRVNPAYCRLTGYEAGELRRMSVTDLLRPDAPRGDALLVRRAIESHEGTLQEGAWYVRKDGSAVPVDVTVTVLRDRDGRPLRALEAAIDVSARERAEQMLRDADRRKDEFLATLAHELRNPLAPVRSAVQILRLKASASPEVQWAHEVIERQIRQMSRLVDDLLDLSRITRNQIALRREEIELAAVVQAAVETSQPLIEQGGHELSISLPPHPVHLHGDITRLAQVFSNLLNNAAKYTPREGRISLSATESGPQLVVSVRDTGMGIPPHLLPNLFEMFTQIDRTLDRSQTGLGIGLALVKRLVEMHGGAVEARSEGDGRGSEFIVRLPRIIRARPGERAPQTEAALPAGSRFRVLVVDDSTDNADSLGMMLGLLGNDVRTAYDGRTALDIAASFHPQVVVLDLGMPVMDGYQTCRLMREEAWGRDARIIALTGWGQGEYRRKTRETGFDHHLVKPVDPVRLMELLAQPPRGVPEHTASADA